MNDPRAEKLEAQGSAGQDQPAALPPFVPFDAVTILDSISDRVLAVDNAWRLVYLNAAAARMWKRDPATLIGQPLEKLLDVNPDNPFRLAYLTSKRNNEPEKASRPYDRDRDGFVMAEGAGIMILEELDHAIKRGAKIYGEIIGYGATADAYHMSSPAPEGEGGYLQTPNNNAPSAERQVA